MVTFGSVDRGGGGRVVESPNGGWVVESRLEGQCSFILVTGVKSHLGILGSEVDFKTESWLEPRLVGVH